jgi:pyruvate dehydrogenase E2 component (dihydrolipoamide acetyltransferase)
VVTDKVTMEVEAQADGILHRILVPEGVEVEVATPIAVIGAPGEDVSHIAVPAASAVAPPESATSAPAEPPAPAEPAVTSPSPGQRHRASPKARRMAAEHGLDLGALTGSGAGGRIVSADVAAALERGPAAQAGPEMTPAQAVGAQRLTASYREAPHIHVSADVDATWMRQLRQGFEAGGAAVSYNDILLRAVALTLVDIPRANSLFEAGRAQEQAVVDIGIATDTPQGLVVPVLRGASGRSIEEISAESSRLVEGARSGGLGPDEYAGGTFTVSNLGMFGVRSFTAILNPPQVAILAVGAIADRVVPLGGQAAAIGVRPTFTATLGIDHRALDGATAARFLQRLREYLESPGKLG